MYNIKEVHYRDIYGKLIWKDNIVFRSLWGVGNELVHDSKEYIVRRVAVADNVQHVNIEPVGVVAVEHRVQSDGLQCTACGTHFGIGGHCPKCSPHLIARCLRSPH